MRPSRGYRGCSLAVSRPEAGTLPLVRRHWAQAWRAARARITRPATYGSLLSAETDEARRCLLDRTYPCDPLAVAR